MDARASPHTPFFPASAANTQRPPPSRCAPPLAHARGAHWILDTIEQLRKGLRKVRVRAAERSGRAEDVESLRRCLEEKARERVRRSACVHEAAASSLPSTTSLSLSVSILMYIRGR